jgi:hypothetical protein
VPIKKKDFCAQAEMIENKIFCMAVPGHAMAQVVSCWPLTAAAWVRAQVNPVGFVVHKVARAGFSLSFSVFPCQYHSTVGSTFPKLKKKIVLSFIHPFTHPHPGMDQRPIKAAAVQ